MSEVRCAYAAAAALGESPVWDPQHQRLYWIDMGNRAHGGEAGASLHQWSPATDAHRVWSLPEHVGCFALRDGDGAILAMGAGVHDLDFETGQITPLSLASFTDTQRRAGLRYNDGRCDRQGRFWFGQAQQVSAELPRGLGALSCYDGHQLRTGILPGITVSNSLAFSPDGRTLYYGDVLRWTVYACDYDPEHGVPGAPRPFITVPEGTIVDGAAVDAEGGYWLALYRAGKVVRYRTDGTVDREIALPVSCPTMLAFGGPELRTLYITTASHSLTAQQRDEQPLAGAVLAVDVDIAGLAEPRFGESQNRA